MLLVDDDPIDRRSFRRKISKTDLDIALEEKHNGETALEDLSSNLYDAVFLDYDMPDINGLTVLRQARQAGYEGPIFILSGDFKAQLMRDAFENGATDYFIKDDFKLDSLVSLLSHLVGEEALRVLIVDDEAMDRRSMTRSMGSAALLVAISEADDGHSGLETLRQETFDCAFVDLQMPGVSGLDLLELAREAGLETPIIILTGNRDTELMRAAFRGGAMDYVIKEQFTSEELNRCLSRAFRSRILRVAIDDDGNKQWTIHRRLQRGQ